jgi:hypothetical protein
MAKLTLKKKGKMYECQVFFPTGFPKKWKYVTDLGAFAAFLSRDHASWKYINVYEKGTKIYLKRFYPGNVIPKVLGLLFAFCLSATHMKTPLIKTTSNTSTNGIYNHATILKNGIEGGTL